MKLWGGALGFLVGGVGLSAALLVMNGRDHRPPPSRRALLADIQVEKKKKKTPPKPKPVKKKKAPKPTTSARAPRPMLATDMSGLSVGVPLFDVDDLSKMGTDLLASNEISREMVLTESAVDQPPRPIESPTPQYPARARARGVEGYVKVRLLVGEDGAVRKVKIVEADPEGVFEDAVLAVARQWRFEPATYQGQAVALAVNRRLTFELK